MLTKSAARVEITDADKGEVDLVFSTKNAIDKDGDVTVDGAFTDGAPVAISAYGHQSWKGLLPVGKGHIRETSTEGVFSGKFFMDTAHGLDTFKVVKEMSAEDGPGQEWSYSLRDIVAEEGDFKGQRVRFLKKITVHEVSPVLVGAGVDTRTLAVKDGTTFSEHGMSVLADVAAFVTRASEVVALRASKGKQLGDESADVLRQIVAKALELDPLLATPTDIEDDDQEAAAREFLRYVALTQGVTT
jgi:hypothetical protein